MNSLDFTIIELYSAEEAESLLHGGMCSGVSRSEIATNLCEIDDSEIDEDDLNATNATTLSSGKSVKWANTVQSTQV